MKHIYLLTVLLPLGCASATAQSMDWLCHPGEYSRIQYVGGDLFKIRSIEGKWGILHADGKMRIDTEYDSITPFIENRALLLDKSGHKLLGIINSEGELIKDLSAAKLQVSRYPHYREGRLVFSTQEGMYGYMNDKGQIVIEPRFYFAAPFQNGVATVQYPNTDYGLINKAGHSVIVSDERYPFISSPVNGKVIAIRGSRKGGDQLAIMRIDGTSLKKDKVLEDGMNIWLSDDFSTIECQLGHSYKIDDQWRVVSSTHGAPIPQFEKEPSSTITENSTVLSKAEYENGVKITYLGNPIMDYPFEDVSTFDKAYAIVQSKDGNIGALILNPSASISIKSTEPPVIFHHNQMKDVILDIELVDVDPSKIKWYRNDQGWLTYSTLEQDGRGWKLRMPYFKASDTYDDETSETVDIAITYDGLDWIHQYVDVKTLHKPGYEVSLTGSDTTGENGKTTLSLQIKSIDGAPKNNGIIKINGGNPISVDKTLKTIPLNVSVPEGSTKSFTYNIEIAEEGCPTYTTKLTKTVSNPIKKKKEQKETKPDNKKKIIII